MTRHLLFIQGGGTGTYDEWDSKLVDNLRENLGPDYEIRYPRMPEEDDPNYAKWKAAIAQEIASLDDGAILVGHSIGGTILINALAEAPPNRTFAGIFLIAAPFVGAGGWLSEEIEPRALHGLRLPATTAIHLYHGSADKIAPCIAPCAHLELYEDAIPTAITHRLLGRDHQLNDDLSEVAAGVRALR